MVPSSGRLPPLLWYGLVRSIGLETWYAFIALLLGYVLSRFIFVPVLI